MAEKTIGPGRPANDPGIKWNGDACRFRRMLKRMTATELGSLIGYSVASVTAWERTDDPAEPPREAVRDIARVLGCRMKDLEEEPKL